MLNFVRRNPSNRPMRIPTIIATRIPTHVAASRLIVPAEERLPATTPTMTPLRPIVEPIDRSISPAMITKVIPNATIPFMDMVRRIFKILFAVKKLLFAKEMQMISTTKMILSIYFEINSCTFCFVVIIFPLPYKEHINHRFLHLLDKPPAVSHHHA